MRKLIVSVHISLDGFVAGPNGEMDWIHVDDELFDYISKLTGQSDAAIYGRVTYQMMDAYWPTAADQPDASKHDIEHSEWYNRVEKYVLSDTLTELKPKTTFLSGDIAEKVGSIKVQSGEKLLMFGSPTAAQTLMRLNLVDELWLFVNPVLLGRGIPFYKDLSQMKRLHLIESHVFSSGVTELHYQIDQEV